MKTYELYWSPEGRRIATVQARDASAAKRKAPKPYRKFLGEIYAVEVPHDDTYGSAVLKAGVL